MQPDKINVYTCPDCHVDMVTVDVDEGTTPFMLGCRSTPGCEGMAESHFYVPDPGHGPPRWEWYKPSAKQIKKASPGMRHHAELGGLFIRARG